ncbi:hypothetical protein Tco_1553540 [Tanacetum coccineum]
MSNNKIVVKFNKYGQPVGVEGNELTQFLGLVVRIAGNVRLNCEDLRKIDKEKKEDMYSIVKATKNNRVQPTRGKLYQISRTRKDGSIVNDKAAQFVVMHPYKLLQMTLLIPKVLKKLIGQMTTYPNLRGQKKEDMFNV